jgi:hypothetical protein
MKTVEVLNRLVAVGPTIINKYVRPGPHCVLATSLGQMTLARFGIHAEPFVAEVTVFNQAWADWGEAGHDGGREEQLRRGAYILSNAPDWAGQSFKTSETHKPWDGHLALKVPDGREHRWLLDLDLGSFNRPQHNILLPGGLLAPLSVGDCLSGVLENSETHTRTSLVYKPLVAPYANDYLTARDWVERDRFTDHVDELEAAITA